MVIDGNKASISQWRLNSYRKLMQFDLSMKATYRFDYRYETSTFVAHYDVR